MFENFKERLQTVQQDFTTGIKTLGEKSKDSKVKRKPRYEEHLPQFSAGVELLSRYEDTWVALHRRSKDCANAGESVDGEVVMLSAHWERRRAALVDLEEQLQQIPAFLSDLESITSRIAHMEGDFEEMESRLLYLENLCAQCEQQRFKQHHCLQLENYKKKKRKELVALKADLNSEHAQKVLEMEHAQQQKLKERQKFFEEAFQQDMEKYISSGYLQLKEGEPAGSPSPTKVSVEALEQVELAVLSDQEALDVFLNSADDIVSTTSSLTSGPDPESWSSDLFMREADPRERLGSSLCTEPSIQESEGQGLEKEASEESGEEPMVQSDEEEVQLDSALVVLPEPLKTCESSDSDSQTSEPVTELQPG
ncbi:dysbindin-A [Osmerus eperlanus]|uniref:dysbindin-A n=1 Tax=Osmerus eperlanus TaxID=29151 RepID=UPI002E0F0067